MHPSERRGLDRAELGRFLFSAERFDHAHAALAVLLGLSGLRVSEACETNIEDMAFERGHRVLRIIGKGNKPALIPLVPRTARTIDLAVVECREGPILLRHDGQRLDRRTAHRWVRSIESAPGSGWSIRTCSEQHSSWPPSTPVYRSERCNWPPATRTQERRPCTTGRRQDFDRHAAYVVVAFVAGG